MIDNRLWKLQYHICSVLDCEVGIFNKRARVRIGSERDSTIYVVKKIKGADRLLGQGAADMCLCFAYACRDLSTF